MLRELDLSDDVVDQVEDGVGNCGARKAADERGNGGGGSKGGDGGEDGEEGVGREELDDLLDLMDATAESK